MKYKFIDIWGDIHEYTDTKLKKEFKTSWAKLHENREHTYKKEYADFLKRFDLRATLFNLNCLQDTGMICLSDTQIKELKGGFE